MQINNQYSANQLQPTDRPLELKQGELYNAQIKERVSDTEAVIQIRGKEVKAIFEGKMPAEDRVTVQVTGQKDQAIAVKTVSTDVPKTSSTQVQQAQMSSDIKLLQNVGITEKDTLELKQSVQVLLNKGIPVTKEAVQELRDFFEKAQGSTAAKLDTVKALANKKLEVTQSHLRPIHEALHGRPLNEVLTDLAKEIDPEFDLAKNEQKDALRRQTQQNVENLQKQTVETTSKEVKAEGTTAPATASTTKAEQTSTQSVSKDKELVDLLQKNRDFVEKAPELKQAIEKVRAEIVKNPAVDRELAQKVEKAAYEAEKLQSIGKERLVQALKDAEEQLVKRHQQRQENLRVTVSQNKGAEGSALREATPREIVKAVKEDVSKTPSLQRSIETVQKQIVDNPKIPEAVVTKVKQAVEEAGRLQQQGRITAGKETLVNILNSVEADLEALESMNKNQQQVKQGESQPAKINPQQVANSEHEPRTSEVVKQVKAEVQREPNLQRIVEKVREQVVNNPKLDVEVAQKVEKAVNEARQLQQIGREPMGRERLVQALTQAENELKQMELRQQSQSARIEQPQPDARPKGEAQTNEARTNDVKVAQAQQPTQTVQKTNEQPASKIVKQAKEDVQRDPNLQRAIEKVRDQVVNNPKIDVEVAKKIDKAVNEAHQLQQIGREIMGREHLSRALAQAESELKQTETRQQQQQNINQNQSEQRTIETIKQIKEAVQKEPNFQRAIEVVRDLLKNNKDIDPKIINMIEKMTNQASQLDQAGRERISNILDQAVDQIKQSNTATAENTKTQSPDLPDENSTKIKTDQQQSQQKQTAQQENNQKLSQILANLLNQEQTTENQKPSPSAQLNEALKQIQKESNLDQAFAQIRKELLSNPNLDLNTIEKIEKAMERSTQLLEKGRELGARQQITNALNEIEQEITKTEPKQLNQPTDQQKGIQDELIKQFDQNEEFQTLPLQAKNILVTKVTQKLAQATHDFRELKREITKNLDTVERLIDTFKKNAYPQAKQMLETTISKLDNAILKSDMMLFTDMKTEKQLMQASSQLADAKKLLAKGNHTEAAKIVHDIKTLLDKINFKPSEQKVMHFVSKETTNLEKIQKPPTQQLLNQFDETARSYVRQEPSARQMFEIVRSLGLNHDSDLAKSLVFQKGGESPFQQGQQDQQNQQQQENLKAALMKLAQTGGDEASTRIAQQAEQALNNLTGQQLLSKSDSGNSLQSMFFTLPLLLGEKPENLQVFVHSKKEGQQVDWENCNLYFLIETKRLGDVGIMLTSTDRNLSITIKNDRPGFKQKMEPIAAITKEKLQEVGYSINSINFTRMTSINSQATQNQQNDTNKQEHQSQMRPVFTEKGMDFKI
ncbi:hypothetical protein [Schinkia azotoformans]|uniref:Flagellar hook-length control protein-like C-terminal domain-containing protein n=1 Tax=Schinkia azotoformans LMG 9581 TaxID=1131731 RepID=K6DHR8_SCHAZ|nr:hypothetical protein [Schinkia azotoformans]EKN67653.1 hypothetical protein BAZO_07224 [Schinkia azotoformans LMG 9581]